MQGVSKAQEQEGKIKERADCGLFSFSKAVVQPD